MRRQTISSVHLARAKNHFSLCYEKMHKNWLEHISNPPNTKQRSRAPDQVSRVQPQVSIFFFSHTSRSSSMCRFSRIFHSWCRHFSISRTPCIIPICPFTGSPQTFYSVEYACSACMDDPVHPTTPPSPVTNPRSRFFDRRDAHSEQTLTPARQRSLLVNTSGHYNHPPQPTYSLYSPMTAKPELLRIVLVAELPENSGNCAICGGPQIGRAHV